ncbi:hypothetical protein [Peribacillus sp. TH24]|uniref:hypothetical protein n=1 Tax=Peribacillus sp. TH24 TaxID=2798483 RepID=UPI00191127D0|nr:hypothetical protein [Peribacillus sp. TH24]MBK5444935.1 hypothetical protein [Peribacillus sp. TH24]
MKYYRDQFNAIKRPLVTMTEKDIKLLILNTVKFVIYRVLVVKYSCSIMGREGKIRIISVKILNYVFIAIVGAIMTITLL